MPIAPAQLNILLLIVARIAGIFVEAPVFNSRTIPMAIKTALIIWLSILIWFVVPTTPLMPSSTMHFVSLLIGQFLIGVIIGFIINIIFLAFQAAGEIIDMQMGLSVAQALDPVFGAVISIIGRLTFNVALIIFLVVNGHHMILSALHQSFTIVPVGALPNLLNPSITGQVIDLGRMLWLTAFQLAGPAILMIFLLDFSFGIVSRVAPQVNVFMLGFQIKPSLGLIAILFTLPFWVKIISKTMETMGGEVIRVLMAIKP